jgi:hypothetical protein
MNEMFIINAYRQGKTWMFDDKQRELVAEPFVLGASELIQKYLDRKGMKRRRKNVQLLFSLQPFPQAEVVLTCTEKCYPMKIGKMSELFGGKLMAQTYNSNVVSMGYDKTQPATSAYYTDQEGHLLWLCPAQLKFFGYVADIIYAKIG